MKVAKARLIHRHAHLAALVNGGEDSDAELADLFAVARSTIYPAVERERALNGAGFGTIVGSQVVAVSRSPHPCGSAPSWVEPLGHRS